ncbi:MAG: DUF2520 domain-containing protein [Bacteroidota bacterium]
MISVVILGTGKVATHLFLALEPLKAVTVVQVYGRSVSALKAFESKVATTSAISQLLPADIYLLAVSDNAIADVSKNLSTLKGLVAHTSGSMPLETLETHRKGVFYPLQTFTKGKSVDFERIPICIEAETFEDKELLRQLGLAVSKQVYELDATKRAPLHLCAVLVNNFTNHLFQIADEICQVQNLPFELLLPLIGETIEKLQFLTPKEAQTGPAVRNDQQTMQRHVTQLTQPLHQAIYLLLSESIKQVHEKELQRIP